MCTKVVTVCAVCSKKDERVDECQYRVDATGTDTPGHRTTTAVRVVCGDECRYSPARTSITDDELRKMADEEVENMRRLMSPVTDVIPGAITYENLV